MRCFLLHLEPGGGVAFDEVFQGLDGGKVVEVTRDKHLLVKSGGGVLHLGLVFLCAEQEADGWLVALGHHLVLPEIEIKVHLPGIAVLEGPHFEVDEEVAFGPVAFQAFVFIESTLPPVVDGEQFDEVSSGEPQEYLRGKRRGGYCRGS